MISHMYFYPSEKLMKALIKASKRGVKIIITTNKNDSLIPGMQKLHVEGSHAKLTELLQKGNSSHIEIFEYAANYTTLHKKVIIVDRKTVALGSANMGHKSLEGMKDNEINLVIESESFANETKKILDKDNENSKQLTGGQAVNSDDKVISYNKVKAEIQDKFLNPLFL